MDERDYKAMNKTKNEKIVNPKLYLLSQATDINPIPAYIAGFITAIFIVTIVFILI